MAACKGHLRFCALPCGFAMGDTDSVAVFFLLNSPFAEVQRQSLRRCFCLARSGAFGQCLDAPFGGAFIALPRALGVAEAMPHIVVRNLTVRYDGHEALREVSVEIPDGQITVVLGPSGCGKTTFFALPQSPD
ncbi:MAG: hypothetical protein HZLCBSQH_001768 [Candidatus Fervidibacterota bacterium]